MICLSKRENVFIFVHVSCGSNSYGRREVPINEMTGESVIRKMGKPVVTRKKSRVVSSGKGKKRDVKRNIPTELIPIEEETWLLQPIAVTMMRHDYSLIQIRILVSIVEFMQNKLYDILNRKKT